MEKNKEQTILIIAITAIVGIVFCGGGGLLVLVLMGPRVVNVVTPVAGGRVVAATAVAETAVPPTAAPSPTIPVEWQTYPIPDFALSVAYPPTWYVHTAGKMLQITPNAQPTWSSYFDPNEPHGGPTFDLLYNLNREMGPTPLAEVENIALSWAADAEIEAMTPPAPLADRPDIVVGVYYYTVGNDTMALLLGALENPAAPAGQPVMAMTAVVDLASLETMQTTFTTILRSLQPIDPSPAESN